MKKDRHETSIRSRLTLSCRHMGMTVVELCAKVGANTSGLYKALNNHSETYSHYEKMCTHLKIGHNWLIYGASEEEPVWMNQKGSIETHATRPPRGSRSDQRRRRTTLGDDEVADRLEILERRYAVVADRFLSLAERAENEGVFVSPREIDEIKDDLENLTGK